MFEAIAGVLSLIVKPCYQLTGNWWVSILLFTIIVKIILMPLSLWCQKNSIVMVKLMPHLNRLKVKYYGDRETIGEKQSELYKEQGYHPMLSLVPLAVQVIILFGLVDVIHGITDHGAPGTEFLGMVPIEDGGLSWIMPILACLSAVIMGCAQNVINPLQREQSRAEKNTTNGLSIALSLFLGVFVAAGMAFYWICSNLTAIAVQAICNICIKPKRHIDYEDLQASREELEALESLSQATKRKRFGDPLVKREKEDYKRFFKIVGKHLVFTSEGSGFYKYYRGAIEWLLKNSDMDIHYVTNDPDDQIFDIAKNQPRIKPYYIDVKRQITLMMKMDADVVVTTQEDLDNYYIKRSYIRNDVEYLFMFHHMTSTHLTAQAHAYDNYDALLCVGPHQVEEVRKAEKMRGLPAKDLPQIGYDLLDGNIASYQALGQVKNEKPTVIIAPSWQEDCILDSCINDLISPLLGNGYKIIVRPHPEYTKRYKHRWEALQARYASVSEDELYFERDFSSNSSVFTSDVMVTDWSSVFCEFAFSTLKPCVFINTPMKVTNPEWKKLGITPADISLRDKVGVSIDLDKLSEFPQVVSDMAKNPQGWHDQVQRVRDQFIFNVGSGAEHAGEYILSRVLTKQRQRKETERNDA